jgi:predicted kinase
MKLIIYRGVPGSGKTFLANKNHPDTTKVAADDFMVGEDGEYAFDPARLKECHARCLLTAADALYRGKNVVVHNTFTQMWELEPYIILAEMAGARLIVYSVVGEWGNTHGVPRQKIREMANRWETFPGEKHIRNDEYIP